MAIDFLHGWVSSGCFSVGECAFLSWSNASLFGAGLPPPKNPSSSSYMVKASFLSSKARAVEVTCSASYFLMLKTLYQNDDTCIGRWPLLTWQICDSSSKKEHSLKEGSIVNVGSLDYKRMKCPNISSWCVHHITIQWYSVCVVLQWIIYRKWIKERWNSTEFRD